VPVNDPAALDTLSALRNKAVSIGLASKSIALLDCGDRILNVLKSSGIREIGQFTSQNCSLLFERKGVGVSFVQELVRAFTKAVQKGHEDPHGNEEQGAAHASEIEVFSSSHSTQQSILSFCDLSTVLDMLNERDRVFLELYAGCHGASLTLEQIGERYGVSRERVRQIKSRALRRALANLEWLPDVANALVDHLNKTTQPLFFELASEEIANVPRLHGSIAVWAVLFHEASQKRLHIWQDCILPAFALFERSDAEGHIQRIFRAVLAVQNDAKLSDREASEYLLRDQLQARGLLHCASLVYLNSPSVSEAYLQWKEVVAAVPRTKSPSELVVSFLSQLPVPRSAREIHQHLREMQSEVSLANLRNLLNGHPRIVGVSRRRFVIDSYFDPYDSVLRRIAKKLETFCTREENLAKQWSAKNLAQRIDVGSLPFEEEDIPRVLDYALKRHTELQYLGRSVWQAAAGRAESRNRELLKDLVVRLIKEAGGQMSRTDLSRQIRTYRRVQNLRLVLPTSVELRSDGMIVLRPVK